MSSGITEREEKSTCIFDLKTYDTEIPWEKQQRYRSCLDGHDLLSF
jgi:hypothetical protein